MVRYHGRARERTGAVNRIQPGLKMAGLLGTVRAPISAWRIQQRRVRPSGVGCTASTRVSSGTAGVGKRRVFDKKLCVTCVNNTTINKKGEKVPIKFLALAAPASRQCAGGVNRHFPLGCR